MRVKPVCVGKLEWMELDTSGPSAQLLGDTLPCCIHSICVNCNGQSFSCSCGFVTFLWLVRAITKEILKLLLHWRWLIGRGGSSWCEC